MADETKKQDKDFLKGLDKKRISLSKRAKEYIAENPHRIPSNLQLKLIFHPHFANYITKKLEPFKGMFSWKKAKVWYFNSARSLDFVYVKDKEFCVVFLVTEHLFKNLYFFDNTMCLREWIPTSPTLFSVGKLTNLALMGLIENKKPTQTYYKTVARMVPLQPVRALIEIPWQDVIKPPFYKNSFIIHNEMFSKIVQDIRKKTGQDKLKISSNKGFTNIQATFGTAYYKHRMTKRAFTSGRYCKMYVYAGNLVKATKWLCKTAKKLHRLQKIQVESLDAFNYSYFLLSSDRKWMFTKPLDNTMFLLPVMAYEIKDTKKQHMQEKGIATNRKSVTATIKESQEYAKKILDMDLSFLNETA
jgi:hypothetical protein